ncbi:terminase large subunit [Thiohalocapsa phage LS06-2018-MD03]|nr:terminase large subunit [Thiohalocapsa phage LS06-2018-MD03]
MSITPSYSAWVYVGDRTKEAYSWQKPQSTVDWVQSNVRLNADTSPVTGMLNLKYSPHLIEMFNDYDKRQVWKQIGEFSTQCGKTLFLQCCMASKLDRKPTKLQWAIPNESGVSDYILDKIDPFIRGIDSLNAKVEDYTKKEKQRTKRTRIKVAGGDTVFTGTSASSKRSKTVKELYMDEADLFGDGSMIELEGRTKSYEKYGRKVLATSSKSKKNGEISKAGASCEAEKEWRTVCNKCGHHWLAGSEHFKFMTKDEYLKTLDNKNTFEQVRYKFIALKDVYLECPSCSHKIHSRDKDKNILDGNYKFVITKGDTAAKSIHYRGNALAMFFTSFETIAGLLIDAEATGTFDDMAQIYLDYFNEIYEPETETVDKNDILLLSNNLDSMQLPENTYKLYLTIDTQKTGFWFKVTAFEYGFIANTIHHGFVETFDELELLMGYRFKKPNGDIHLVNKTLIDRMGIKERTIEVDAWIEDMIVNHGMEGMLYPSMGIQRDASGRQWYKTTLTKDVTTGERRTTPVEAVKLNNTLLKNELQNLIDRSIKKVKGEDGYQDAHSRLYYINQQIVDDANSRDGSISVDYERQMTSEQYVYKINSKTSKVADEKTWEKVHNSIDNHLWDCSVAAIACALMDNVILAQKPKDNAFETELGILGLDI